MKNKTQLIKLVLAFVLMNLCKNSYGQFTTAGFYPESSAGVTVGPWNTGNDILEFGGDIYRVSAWCDNSTSPGISWDVDYGGSPNLTGNTVFAGTTNIYHADVCLVVDQFDNTVCAVVCWHAAVSPGAWYVEVFEWDNSSAFVSMGATLLMNGSFGTTVNVDGDDIYDFVIVFDDIDQQIWAFTGDLLNGSGVPTIHYAPGVAIAGGTFPDACIYNNGGTETVHVTYLDVFGDLTVDDHLFATLASGSPGSISNILSTSPTSLYYFSDCRIACPNSGSVGEWTVVVHEFYRDAFNPALNVDLIEGFNDNSGATPIIYNDGTYVSSGDLTSVSNFHPVVAYDNQYPTDGIWVGWTMDNLGNTIAGAVDAMYPLVLKCDNDALPVISNYWEVPNSLGSTDYVYLLSLAGRYASDALYMTYYNVGTSGDIYNKWVTTASAATSLRTTNSNGISQLFTEAENNLFENFTNSNMPFTLKVFDLNGNLILIEKGNENKLRDVFKRNSPNFSESIYLAQIISDDGAFYMSRKVFLGN